MAMFEQITKIKMLVGGAFLILAIMLGVQIVSAVKINKMGSRGEVFVLACDVDALKKDKAEIQQSIEALKKDRDELRQVAIVLSQRIDGVAGNHNQLVQVVQGITAQQNGEMIVMGRALSEKFGGKAWLKSVASARAEIQEEVREAQKAAEAEAKKADAKKAAAEADAKKVAVETSKAAQVEKPVEKK